MNNKLELIKEIKKCGISIKIGYGTYNRNPDDLLKNDYNNANYCWIYYDNYWYICKENIELYELYHKIIDNSYCKEHVINNILNLI